jgi:threonine/homoserine/homoserine lactone efflux protein
MNFVPDLQVLLAFSVAAIVLAITPGPDMSLFVGRALSQGRAAGLAVLCGTMFGIVVHTVLVAFGVSALVVASPTAFAILKTGGAAYLFFLAVQAIRVGSTFRPRAVADRRKPFMTNLGHGLAVNLLNPKVIIFFMTFLPQFVSAGDPDIRNKLLFLGLYYNVISLPVVIPMILAAGQVATWLRDNPRVLRGIDVIFAAIFSIFAVRILFLDAK